MSPDKTTKALLAVIAAALLLLALRPLAAPPPVAAQSQSHNFYVEPGVKMLRAPDGSKQMYGKVMVDMRTGDIWGFPTWQADSVYPVDALKSAPPVSQPFKLGRFALDQASSGQ